MTETETRAILRILIDSSGAEEIAVRLIEVLNKLGYTDVVIEFGLAKAKSITEA